MAGSSGNEEFL